MKKGKLLFSVFIFLAVNVFSQNKIVLHGVAEDSRIGDLRLSRIDDFPSKGFRQESDFRQNFEKDENNFSLEIDGEKGRYMLSVAGYGSHAIYLTPGDSLSFTMRIDTINNKKQCVFSFSGDHSSDYNFDYYKKCFEQTLPIISDEHKKDPLLYKRALEEKRDKLLKYLETYRQENGMSVDSYNMHHGDIINTYICDLYSKVVGNKDFFKENILSQYKDDDWQPVKGSVIYSAAMLYKYIYSISPNIFEDIETVYQRIISHNIAEEREYLYAFFFRYIWNPEISTLCRIFTGCV